jgi:hypothetical protein
MKTKIGLFIGALMGGATIQAATLFTYDFADVTTAMVGSSGSAGGTGSNLAFSNFVSSGVAANPNTSSVFSFTGWSTGATTASDTFGGAIDLTDYYSFTITPSGGFSYSISSITFDAGRTATGPRQFVVRSSADGFSANLSASESQANVSIVGSNVFQFTDNTSTTIYTGMSVAPGGSVVSTAVTYRIYSYNAESSAGGFRVDNVVISGTVTAVPEPSTTTMLFGVIALAAIVVRRSRHAGGNYT